MVKVTQVHQAANLWAIKKIMSLAQNQVQQIIQAAPVTSTNLEPHKGRLLDGRL